MSFDTLKEAILKEARAEAEQISSALNTQASEEKQRIADKARMIEEDVIAEAEHEADRRAKLVRQEAELGGRASVLQAKEQALTEAKEAFVKNVLEQDEAGIKDLLKKLLATVGYTSGTIVPGEVHLSQLKDVAGAFDVDSESIPKEGGFIFRGEKVELNLTISHLADQLFQKHRAELAKMLFE